MLEYRKFLAVLQRVSIVSAGVQKVMSGEDILRLIIMYFRSNTFSDFQEALCIYLFEAYILYKFSSFLQILLFYTSSLENFLTQKSCDEKVR